MTDLIHRVSASRLKGPDYYDVLPDGEFNLTARNMLSSGMPTAVSSQLFDLGRAHQLKAGDVLFAVGDAGDGCYRLDQGCSRWL